MSNVDCLMFENFLTSFQHDSIRPKQAYTSAGMYGYIIPRQHTVFKLDQDISRFTLNQISIKLGNHMNRLALNQIST